MRVYAQLIQGQRYPIEALLKTGHNQTMMPKYLLIDKSTISREIRRNRGLRGYRPKQAHEKAMIRCSCKFQPHTLHGNEAKIPMDSFDNIYQNHSH